jgi:hypothetical protein
MSRATTATTLLLLSLSACAPLPTGAYDSDDWSSSPAERPAARRYSQAELDQMLAPIALYPDALLAQLLMAATYPRDLAEAADWLRRHPGYSSEAAVRAAQNDPATDWDPSVRSLLTFPTLLQRMADHASWSTRLGAAFLGDARLVMASLQNLRRMAYDAGTLRSNERIYVFPTSQAITIEPNDPQVVHLPSYDPNTAFGPWRWPGNPPFNWGLPGSYNPPPANVVITPQGRYSSDSNNPATNTIRWSSTSVSSSVFFGAFDWRQQQVYIQPQYREHWHYRPQYNPQHNPQHNPQYNPPPRYSGSATYQPWRHESRTERNHGHGYDPRYEQRYQPRREPSYPPPQPQYYNNQRSDRNAHEGHGHDSYEGRSDRQRPQHYAPQPNTSTPTPPPASHRPPPPPASVQPPAAAVAPPTPPTPPTPPAPPAASAPSPAEPPSLTLMRQRQAEARAKMAAENQPNSAQPQEPSWQNRLRQQRTQ